MDRVDAIVVGAGVIGLAIGRALAQSGHETLILEGEADFGSWTSARNSEVIHAGLYYPQGSLKATLCVEGRERLFAFCADRGVPHRRLGKVIFAANEAQRPALDAIMTSARDAGVGDLVPLDRAGVAAIEPALDAIAGIYSPSTGIVDSHALMQAYLGDAESAGARLVTRTLVSRIERIGADWLVHVDGVDGAVVATPVIVNAAGLAATDVARRIDGLDDAVIPATRFARGTYFTYAGRVPFSHLVYPVPQPGGLGTHLTLDLAGRARFGPNVEWIDTIDYAVRDELHGEFLAAARLIWPELDPDRLVPGYAGIRPKLSGPGEPPADFVISTPEHHGLSGLVNLFGIESPGLTASLAIADRVEAAVRDAPRTAWGRV